ncbi:F-box associated domain containing protein [Tanacetum coccineum]
MNHETTIRHRGRLKWIEVQDKVVEVEKEQLVDVVTIHDVDLSRLGLYGGFDLQVDNPTRPSVNGLIYVWDTYRLTCIVNPIARQYLTLPDPQPTIVSLLGYGFGSSDDASYKVIHILERFLPPAYEDKIIQIEVFTLGTDNRRVLQPNDHFSNICGYMGDGLFFNGRVHWINAGGHQLFVFDLDNETFNLFPSPPFEGDENEQKYRGILGVLKGCLSQAVPLSLDRGVTVYITPPPYLVLVGLGTVVIVVDVFFFTF